MAVDAEEEEGCGAYTDAALECWARLSDSRRKGVALRSAGGRWGGAGRHCVASISTTMGAAAGAVEGAGCAVSETTVSLSESEELSSGADASSMAGTGACEMGMWAWAWWEAE